MRPDRPFLVIHVEIRCDPCQVQVRFPVSVDRADVSPVSGLVALADAAVVEALGVHSIARHQMRDEVFAEVVAGAGGHGIPLELFVQKWCVKHIDAHAGERHVRPARYGRRVGRLFDEIGDPPVVVDPHDAECRGFLAGNFQTGHRHIGIFGDVVGQHFSVIHFVDMVAGKHQDIVRNIGAQDVEILVHRIGCSEIPVFFRGSLRRGQNIDKLLEAAVEETPAALDVPDQAVRLVLRRHADAADSGIYAVRQRKIDDAEFAAERHGRFGTPVGQVFQPAAAPAGQHERVGILGQHADEADIEVLVDHDCS